MSISPFANPARNPGESFSDYRDRRQRANAWSRALSQISLGSPTQQRQRPTSRQQLRDSQRGNGKGPKGTYSLGILTKQQRDNRDRLQARFPERFDAAGQYITLVGRLRVSREQLDELLLTPDVVITRNGPFATIRRVWKPH